MSRRLPVVLLLTLAAFAGGRAMHADHKAACKPGGASSLQPNGTVTLTGCVERAVDGDTLVVAGEKVRLLGVDTPETHKGPVQCYGPEAASFASDWAVGRQATVRSEPSSGDVYDRYGRLLGYVHVHGRDLGTVELERGYARVYAFRGRHFKKRARYEALEARAMLQNIGRWKAC